MRRRSINISNNNTLLLLHLDNNYKDSSVCGVDATPVGSNVSFVVDSKFGQAIQITNANTYIKCCSRQWYIDLINSGNYTIETFIKNVSGDWGFVATLGDRTNDSFGVFFVTYAGSQALFFGNYNNNIYSSRLSTVSGKWYHIAVTAENGFIRMFVDGVLVGSGTKTFTVFPNVDFAVAGNAPFDGAGRSFIIDEFRISSIARYKDNFMPPATPFEE